MTDKDTQVSGAALMSALIMPLAELHARVDLVERLAIASRHAVLSGAAPAAPATTSAGGAGSPQAGGAGKGDAAKPTAAKAADKAKAAPAPTPAPETTSDADLEAAFGDETSTGNSGGDDFGDAGDMLAGFVPDMSPADARAAATKIATGVITKRDGKELTTAREVMQKYGVSKVSAVADDKIVDLYTDMKAAFPNYA